MSMRGFAAFIGYVLSISIVSAVLVMALAAPVSPADEFGPTTQAQKTSPAAKRISNRPSQQAVVRTAKSRIAVPNMASDKRNATIDKTPSWSHTAAYRDWRKNGT
jgi:hypothetical protein